MLLLRVSDDPMPGRYSSIDASTMEANEKMEIQRLRFRRGKIE
jgi:hypothetical protein